MWVAPSAGRDDTAISRVGGAACPLDSEMGATPSGSGSERRGARSRRPSIAAGSTHDMRVTLMGSGRDHSTHIYYVIILIA